MLKSLLVSALVVRFCNLDCMMTIRCIFTPLTFAKMFFALSVRGESPLNCTVKFINVLLNLEIHISLFLLLLPSRTAKLTI